MRPETPAPAPREEINSWRDDSEAVRTQSWSASGSKTADCAVRTPAESFRPSGHQRSHLVSAQS